MESLRKEMILNEEHRNYIQILKETLDSNLLKCGISNQIKSSLQSPNINQSEITDFVINYHKFQNENEKLKEDLTQMNNILNELKNENETLKSKLEACNAENILIKEHIEKLKSTNFEQTEQNSKNDQDIQTLTINLNSLRNQNALLQNQINELQSMQLTKDKQVQS
jgi:predicted RNase H-like nuclease (RuvC/YqgF family)